MATSVTIRNLSDEAHRELMARAAQNGQSLQELLRTHLEEWTAKPDIKTLMARVRLRKELGGGTDLGIEQILDFKDADRR